MAPAALQGVSLEHCYGHAERIFDVQFHPNDSRVIASASEDCTVRVWSREGDVAGQHRARHKQVLCCYGHEAEALRLGWSLDGRLLASGSADNTVRVWEVPPRPGDGDKAQGSAPSYNGQQVALLSGHPEEVYHCEFVEPGTSCLHPFHALAAAAGGEARPPGDGTAQGPGSHLLAASSESLFLWDLEEGVLTQRADAPGTSGSTVPAEAVVQGYKHAYVFACGLQPANPAKGPQGTGGQLLACACNDGAVRLWALRKNGLQYVGCRELTAGRGAGILTSLCWSSTGTLLAVTVKDGSVLFLDTRRQLHATRTLRLPAPALTATTLPASSPLLQRHQQQGGELGSAHELLLLACADGCLRLCQWEPDAQPGAWPSHQPGFVELNPQDLFRAQVGTGATPPPGQDEEQQQQQQRFSMLALAVSAAGDAVAMAGTPAWQPAVAAAPAANGAPGGTSSSGAARAASTAAPATAAAPPSRRRRGGGGQAGVAAGGPAAALQALDDAVQSMQLTGQPAAEGHPGSVAASAPVGPASAGGAGEQLTMADPPAASAQQAHASHHVAVASVSVRAPVFVWR